ncbi:hypothetical protein DITRI_Ditri02bG0039100 [Diplodiscus trichospermus]
MQRVTSRITRIVKASSSLTTILFNEASYSSSSWLPKRSFSAFSLQQPGQNPQKEAIPGDCLKWGSIGFCRTSRFATGLTPLQPKPLDSIMDLDRAKNRSPEDLASIWDDYHLGRGHIGLTTKAKVYHLLEQRGSDCRYFVIPLWRGSGYTTMFTQVGKSLQNALAARVSIYWLVLCMDVKSKISNKFLAGDRNICDECLGMLGLFALINSIKYKCSCRTCFSLVLKIIKQEELKQLLTSTSFYTEFAESKDLVLIHGDIVFTSKLSDEEANWLLETTLSFYLNDARYKLVERFNREPHDFEFKDVLRALDMPIL